MNFNLKEAKWLNLPNQYKIGNETVTIISDPKTDFWQRTYYGFRNDNAQGFEANIEGRGTYYDLS